MSDDKKSNKKSEQQKSVKRSSPINLKYIFLITTILFAIISVYEFYVMQTLNVQVSSVSIPEFASIVSDVTSCQVESQYPESDYVDITCDTTLYNIGDTKAGNVVLILNGTYDDSTTVERTFSSQEILSDISGVSSSGFSSLIVQDLSVLIDPLAKLRNVQVHMWLSYEAEDCGSADCTTLKEIYQSQVIFPN